MLPKDDPFKRVMRFYMNSQPHWGSKMIYKDTIWLQCMQFLHHTFTRTNLTNRIAVLRTKFQQTPCECTNKRIRSSLALRDKDEYLKSYSWNTINLFNEPKSILNNPIDIKKVKVLLIFMKLIFLLYHLFSNVTPSKIAQNYWNVELVFVEFELR